MPSASLHATRDGPLDADGLAPRLEEGAMHVVVTEATTAWMRRRRALPGMAFSLVFHAAVSVAFVILWHGMVRDLTTPEGIPVEIVDSIPGEGKGGRPKETEGAPAEAKPAESRQKDPEPPALKPALAPTPSPQEKQDALEAALALPSAPLPAPAPPAPPAPPEPPAPPTPAPAAAPALPTPPGETEAPRSALAAPPPEPMAAATQAEPSDKPNAVEKTDKPVEAGTPEPPPPAPEVMTAPQAETAVPAPSKAPSKAEATAPSDPAQEKAKTAAASLSAALPSAAFAMPSTFRAMLSSHGNSASQEYKGVVFGSLARATQALSEEARQRHLKGQVAVIVNLTSAGGIEKAAVIQSSGSPEVDAMALEMVRRAAPFPAPPPGTPRSFTPVISIGEE